MTVDQIETHKRFRESLVVGSRWQSREKPDRTVEILGYLPQFREVRYRTISAVNRMPPMICGSESAFQSRFRPVVVTTA
jgi:hypothetical protein